MAQLEARDCIMQCASQLIIFKDANYEWAWVQNFPSKNGGMQTAHMACGGFRFL